MSVRNTSSNSASPVISSQRGRSPRRAAHVEQKERDALMAQAPGSVRAMRMPQSLIRPPEHHTFWPLTMKRSRPSARVDSDARSLPAPGSENSWHQTCSPQRVGRRWRWHCSGVPNRRRLPAARTRPTMLSTAGTPALAHSSIQTAGGRAAPRPPSSTKASGGRPTGLGQRCHAFAPSISSGGQMAP